MFDIGFFELAICAVVALMVLGPERLPETVRYCGRMVGKAKRFVGDMTLQIEREIEPGPFQQHLKDAAVAIEKEALEVKNSLTSGESKSDMK